MLSQLGKHVEARDHAMNAIVLLQDSLMNTYIPKLNKKRKRLQDFDAETVEK